jgi:hypothetical protein
MAFVLKAKSEGFFYSIQLPVITETGASQIQKFDFKFKRISRSKINELQRQQEELNKGDFEIDSLERDVDYVMEIAEGWRYVQDETGKDVPFTRENVHALLDAYPNAAGEIVKGFFESTLGGGAKRKN